jgi:hypothetical protein
MENRSDRTDLWTRFSPRQFICLAKCSSYLKDNRRNTWWLHSIANRPGHDPPEMLENGCLPMTMPDHQTRYARVYQKSTENVDCFVRTDWFELLL